MFKERILNFEDMPVLMHSMIKSINELNRSVEELKLKNSKKGKYNVYTTKEASDLLGIKVSTLRTKISSGEIGASFIGKSYVLTQNDIDKFLEINHTDRYTERDLYYRKY
jgi:excisionase family DNA binding protein